MVLGAQIDLIVRTIHPEPHRLIRRAPIKIIFELDGYLLCHPGLLVALGLPAPYKIHGNGRGVPVAPPATPTDTPARPGAISSAPRQPAPRQVCPLPMRIVLSYLTLWAQRSRAQNMASLEIHACMAPAGYGRGQVL
jgi:hypothetical protein